MSGALCAQSRIRKIGKERSNKNGGGEDNDEIEM